ncbi:MAG: hypothetical protein SGJ09_13540 [Phycisphaerae bacterium]|nr:hypothetical protein [Phycisphaerae bacterium]
MSKPVMSKTRIVTTENTRRQFRVDPRGIPHSWEAVGSGLARLLKAATPSSREKMFEELNTLPPGPPDFAKVAEMCGRYGVTFV